MQTFAYFPALVYREERPDLIQNALPVCKSHLDQIRTDGGGLLQSNQLAYEPALREVADYLLMSSVSILRSQGYLVDNYDFYLQGLWAQEVNRGSGTIPHAHKNSQICGWFFLEVPKTGVYPVYHDCRMNKGMVELDFAQGTEITNATSSIHFNDIVPGTVLFSNSWIPHQLLNNESDVPARCIHFVVSHKERLCNTY